MADEHKEAPKPEDSKPEDPKGKDNRYTEPLMNFELPEDSKPELKALEEPIEAAEVVEEEVPLVEEEAPVVVELDDDAVEVIEDEPQVVHGASASDVAHVEPVEVVEEVAPTAQAKENAAETEASAEDLLEVVEALPSSSKVIDAPLVEEVAESGVDLTSTQKGTPAAAKAETGSESDIDLNALLDESPESSAVDLGAGKPTSLPASPVVQEIEEGEGGSPKDEEVKDDEKADADAAMPAAARGKKGRDRELVGAGAGGKGRGGFLPFFLGSFVAALVLAGGGVAAWYVNLLPESPMAEKKSAPKSGLPMKKQSGGAKAVADPAAEKPKLAEEKQAELPAAIDKNAEERKQLEQDHAALKKALEDANLPQEPDKLKAYVADLMAARNKPADAKDPVAKAENNDVDAQKLKALAAENEALVNERAGLAKKLDDAVQAREAAVKDRDALLKDPDASAKEREALVKKLDDAVQAREALAKEHEAAVKDHEALVKERDTAVKERDTLVKHHEEVVKDRDLLKIAVEAGSKKLKESKLLGNDGASAKQPVAGIKKALPAPEPEIAVQPNPAMAEKHFSRGLDFFWARRYTDAESELVKAVALYDDDARYRYFLGMARYMQGTTDKRKLAGLDFDKGAQLERSRHPSSREVNASLERVQGYLRTLIDGYRERPGSGG